MKNKRLIYSALLSGILVAATGCSENEQSVPLDENELIELQVSPKVTLTRSAINGGEQTGNGANVMQNIAVYAQSTITNTDAKKNNYAIYTQSSGKWSNSGTDKIYLSSEDATVYAYYPAYKPGSNGEYATSTALKISGDASASSTIPLTVYEGGAGTASEYTITSVGNADKTWNGTTNAWEANRRTGRSGLYVGYFQSHSSGQWQRCRSERYHRNTHHEPCSCLVEFPCIQ